MKGLIQFFLLFLLLVIREENAIAQTPTCCDGLTGVQYFAANSPSSSYTSLNVGYYAQNCIGATVTFVTSSVGTVNVTLTNNTIPPFSYYVTFKQITGYVANGTYTYSAYINSNQDPCPKLIGAGSFTVVNPNCPQGNTYYTDVDHDGYGTGAGQFFCTNPGAGWSSQNSDCNDGNAAIHPGATEICNGIDDNCDGVIARTSSGDENCNDLFDIGRVMNISVNTTIGKLDTLPLEGVRVVVTMASAGAYEQTVTTNAEGRILVSALDPNEFYNLTFFYQDADGIASDIYMYYTYRNFKPVEPLNDIFLPYKMLLQTNSVLDSIRDKPPYQLKVLFGLIETSIDPIVTRRVYDLQNVENLLNGWRDIDNSNSEISVVTDDIGRVYIAMYAHNEFANDAYLLSQIPPKALSNFVLSVLDLAMAATKFSSGPDNNVIQNELITKMWNAALQAAIKAIVLNTKGTAEQTNDQQIKTLTARFETGLKLSTIFIKEKNQIVVDLAKELAKNLLTTSLMVPLYELHMSKTQNMLGVTVPNYAEFVLNFGTFEQAYKKVIFDFHNEALVDAAHSSTNQVIEYANMQFANSDFANFAGSVGTFGQSLGNLSESPTKAFKAGAGLMQLFQAIVNTFAASKSLKRHVANSYEQAYVNEFTYIDPFPADDLNRLMRISGNSRLLNSNDLSAAITAYNAKLDSIVLLIQSNRNKDAAQLSVQLFDLDSAINSELGKATIRTKALASVADSLISGFNNDYQAVFLSDENNSILSRSIVSSGLTGWFSDTTETSYLDTLIHYIVQVKIANVQAFNTAVYFDSIMADIEIPVRVMVTDISGLTEIYKGTSTPIKIKYENFGNQTAQQAYIKLEIDGGFSVASDSILLGDIPAFGTGEITFNITAPLTDTFSVYSIFLRTSNGEGDNESHYIISRTPETCNGIDDDKDGQIDNGVKSIFYQDNDNDGFGNAAVTTQACTAPEGYVNNSTDCDDTKANVHPGATEICNGIDDDCDGQIDEGVQSTFYRDADGDGYGNPAITILACTKPAGYVANSTDCNDNNSNIHPGAIEICGNTSDDNCNGLINENCPNGNPPKININNLTITEGNTGTTNAIFTVSLTKPWAATIAVQYETYDSTAIAGQDYIQKNGTLLFTPNTTTMNVTVPVTGDVLDEPNEFFKLRLFNAINAIINDGNAKAKIEDDDPEPAIRVNDTTVAESSLQAIVRVNLTAQSAKIIEVQCNTKDRTAKSPQDFTEVNSSVLRFLPGETTKFIAVNLVYDALNEPSEFFELKLKQPDNATLSAAAGGRNIADITILNSQPPTTRIMTNEATIKQAEVIIKKDLNQAEEKQQIVPSPVLYPNPADQQINIKLSKEMAEGKIIIHVMDSKGNIVKRSEHINNLKGQIIIINTADLASGLYVVMIRDSKGTRTQIKVVLQH